jgi:hypothetical protein
VEAMGLQKQNWMFTELEKKLGLKFHPETGAEIL